MARLYGEKEDINTDSVKDFFDRRASKEVDNLMVITSFQEKENLNKRQEEESKVLLDKISALNIKKRYFLKVWHIMEGLGIL